LGAGATLSLKRGTTADEATPSAAFQFAACVFAASFTS
jgi:hypothetical protein